MPRINRVQKARKERKCGKCGDVITAGQPYIYWEFRFGGMRVRCSKASCYPRHSELTQSAFLGTLYGIQESIEDATADFQKGGDPSDYANAVESAASDLRDLGEEAQGSLDNMPEGLQQGDTGQLLQERVDQCESLADELEYAASDVEGIELINIEEWQTWAAEEGYVPDENESAESYEARIKSMIEEANEQTRQEAVNAVEAVDLSIE